MEAGIATHQTTSSLPFHGRNAWRVLTGWLKRIAVPPRFHAFEFCDQSWLRGTWREAYMDGLRFLFKLGGVYRHMHVPYSRWAAAAGHNRVLDLASGNGGPAETMIENAQRNGTVMPTIVLSDLYPDVAAFDRLKNAQSGQIGYIADKVDATAAECGDIRLISICSAFHHFAPDHARQLLGNAIQNADGIFIMEVSSRNLLTPLIPLLNLAPLMLAGLFAQRISLRKIMITSIVPIVPLMIIFDGIVSALRSYRPEEILDMLLPDQRHDWQWESGSQRYLAILCAPYVFGVRRSKDTCREDAL